MPVARRLSVACLVALLLVLASGLFHAAHAQGATVDWPTGYGKATQAPGGVDPDAEPASTLTTAARAVVPGYVSFSPSLTFWPSASRLARILPAWFGPAAVQRRAVLGYEPRQRSHSR